MENNDQILTEIAELKTAIEFLIEDIKEIKDGVKTINGRGWENKNRISTLDSKMGILYKLSLGIIGGMITVITLILGHII
jgi:hypothetical protein